VERPVTARLPLRRKLGWAVGDFGFNLYWQTLNLLLMPFYTDVLGLDARLAGTVFLVASLWDGFADSVIGAIADRTRTRWGSYRPYLVFASPFVAVAFAFCFLVPSGGLFAEQSGLFLYALLSQVLMRTAYSVVSIPYSSLSARISGDADERASLAGWRMFFAFSGGAAVTYLMPTLVARAGGEGNPFAYVAAAATVGLLSLPIFWLCFAETREPPREVESNPKGFSLSGAADDVRTVGRMLVLNGPLMRVFACIIVSSLAFTMTNKALTYYVNHTLERPDLKAVLVPMALVAQLAFSPFWAWVARRRSKRDAWLFANLWSAAAYAAFWLIPSRDPVIAAGLLTAVSAANVGYQVLFWAMLPDTVEYNAYVTGQRHDAKVFGLASFAKQLALGVNGFLFGWLLFAIGYVDGVDVTPATADGIKAIMTVVPLIGVAVSAVVMWGYRLDQAEHARVSAAAEQRLEPGFEQT
jgi:GPH family glycoside/pentoside/hexuronide:cation symporter